MASFLYSFKMYWGYHINDTNSFYINLNPFPDFFGAMKNSNYKIIPPPRAMISQRHEPFKQRTIERSSLSSVSSTTPTLNAEKLKMVKWADKTLQSDKNLGKVINISVNMFTFFPQTKSKPNGIRIYQYQVLIVPEMNLKQKRVALFEYMRTMRDPQLFPDGCVFAYDGDAKLLTSLDLGFEDTDKFDFMFRGYYQF